MAFNQSIHITVVASDAAEFGFLSCQGVRLTLSPCLLRISRMLQEDFHSDFFHISIKEVVLE